MVQEVRSLIKKAGLNKAYRHVPRRLNSIPDAMCREALAAKADVNHYRGKLPAGAEKLDITALYEAVEADATQCTVRPREINAICAVWDERLRGKPCKECNTLRGEDDMVVCDRCEDCYHAECGDYKGLSPVHRGPWYCFRCRGELYLLGFSDPIENVPLIDYLWLKNLPKDHEQAVKIVNMAKMYHASGSDLQVETKQLGLDGEYRWVNIPPKPIRKQIIMDTHLLIGHFGVTKTLEAVQQAYWWPSMRAEVAAVLQHCEECQKDKLPPPKSLAPNVAVRPNAPFKVWAIDLAGPLPPD